MTQFTFTVLAEEEHKFNQILNRLEPEEYTVIESLHPINPNDKRCDRQAIMVMDPEAALTFRLGMTNVKIRRARSDEELAEEKRINDMNTVRITIKVDNISP